MQRINFYFEEYHPKPLSFDSRFAGIVIIISVLGFLSIGWIESRKLNNLTQNFSDREVQVSELQNKIIITQKKLSKEIRGDNNQNDLVLAKKDLDRYKKLSTVIQFPIKKSTVSYSQILSDLSKKNVQSVWLTRINISEESLDLEGSTTDTIAIPKYVNQLKQADSLNRYFDELKIERKQKNPLLVDFELNNGQLINNQLVEKPFVDKSTNNE